MPSKRHLAAIMFTDIVGFTAMMQQDEQTAVQTVKRHHDIINELVPAFNGEVIKHYGDGCLSIYDSATEALQCAIQIQIECNKGVSVPLRIGIHIGEIFWEDNELLGDGVNLTSRIESLGQTGTVLFSEDVHQKVRNNPEFKSVALGTFEFKNVSQPMAVYALANEGFPVPKAKSLTGKLKSNSANSWIRSKTSLVVITLVVITLIALFYIYQTVPGISSGKFFADLGSEKSIAVLPFDNLSNLPEQEFFAEGIADEIRSQLFAISNLKVISRSSSHYYSDKVVSLKVIGKELGVKYVLEGNVQRVGDIIRVAVQLSNTRTDKLEWSPQPFERKIEDVFLLQNEISEQIAMQLKLQLSETERVLLAKIPTKNKDAYTHYRKGQQLLSSGGGAIAELEEAKMHFEKAIELDPKFSKAYVGLADTYLHYIFWGRAPSKEVMSSAFKAAFKALELDDQNGECFGILGKINFYLFQKETADSYLEKAIKISPGYVGAYEYLAWIRIYDGDIAGAISLVNKASELDPVSNKYFGNIGMIYYLAHRYDEGLQVITERLKKYPDDDFLLWIKGMLNSAMGRYDESITSFHARSVGTHTNWMLGYTYGVSGNHKEAEKILNYLLEKRSKQYVPAFMIATVYMGLGDKEHTLEWLEQDYEEGGQDMLFWGLKNDIKFNPIRNEERFKELLRKIKV